MSAPAYVPAPAHTSNGSNSEPPRRHLARMSERRFDGTVDTLCGIKRRVMEPPKPNAQPCEKCQEVLRFINGLEAL